MDLPTCNPGVNCLQFGDFNVYSLPLLNLQAGFGSVPSPGDPFFASSTYGQIQNDTIFGINNGQFTTTGNPPTTTDGSYNTPSANNITTFSTFTATDPTGGPQMFGAGTASGDKNSWDTTVGALQTLIGGASNPLVAFFAFNETGSGTGLLTTDLLVWARVTLYNYTAANTFTTGPSFYLSGDGSTNVPDVNNLPPADGSQGFGPWVYVHAGICVSGTTFTGFPDASGNCAVGSVDNQNNLGQNAAAFALNSPSLDSAMQSGSWNVFSIDWQMAYINGGGETAWIMPTSVERQVPEPDVLALLGVGFLGLGLSRYARRARGDKRHG